MDKFKIAVDVHNAISKFCKLHGDNSVPEWNLATDEMKDITINGVEDIINGVVKSPEDSHNKWMEHKIKDGWKYGKYKNVDKKEHPSLIPYEQLSTYEKQKDKIFFDIVRFYM